MDSLGKSHLLVVEDEAIFLDILLESLSDHGYFVHIARTGAEAMAQIAAYADILDAILLDRLLPDMDSLVLLPQIKANAGLVHVPIIIQTSLSAADEIAAGLKAGAYYYLTKPFSPDTLLSIVRAAVADRCDYLQSQARIRQTQEIMRNLDRGVFRFSTPTEARDLATLASHAAPDPSRVVLGLTELMLNAVEHGNLAITYDEKTRLIADSALELEIERRLASPDFSGRTAYLALERTAEALIYTVSDAGNGFDWATYLELAPERAFDTHGRGIAMSRLMSFDYLEYLGCGNQVRCRIDFG